MPGRAILWVTMAVLILAAIGAATQSPFLAWRDWVYIGAGFSGILGFALLLVQPVLSLPRRHALAPARGRRLHKWLGGVILLLIVLHVVGLWITSPPDVMDALMLRSPTPFSLWGVLAMWAAFATAALALLRRPLRLGPKGWRSLHGVLVAVIVGGGVAHALLIEGTMEIISKVALCFGILALTLWAFTQR